MERKEIITFMPTMSTALWVQEMVEGIAVAQLVYLQMELRRTTNWLSKYCGKHNQRW